ncbi:ATP-dependent RNA helicase SUB2 [Fusarium oxysporum f. sp. albedinis]|nr:ATP-dependent RNA helicase SUB2 [Fusarium oxysporum f. sp. albedinis]
MKRLRIPWKCPGKVTCLYDEPYSAVGCCWSEPCTVVSVCLDYTAVSEGQCNGENLNAGTSCCSDSGIPYCQTWKFSDIPASLVWCTDVQPTAEVIMFEQPILTASDTISTDRSSSSTGPATTSTSTSTEEAPSPTETSEGKSGGMSSENTIALGVGIPAAVAGIVSAVLDVWLVKRRRRIRALPAVPAVISSGDSSSS